MEKQENRFKVQNIEEYNKLIKSEKTISERAFLLGTVGLAVGMNFIAAGYVEEETVRAFVDIIIGSGSVCVGTTSIYFMAQALSKKTMLESKVEKLNDELDKSRSSR